MLIELRKLKKNRVDNFSIYDLSLVSDIKKWR